MPATTWIGLIVSAGVAFVVALLTHHFSSGREERGRVWTRKAEAYTAILGAAAELEELHDAWFRDQISDIIRSENLEEERRKEYRAARRQIERTCRAEQWLLPPAVIAEIDKAIRVLNADYRTWMEEVDAGLAEIRRSRKAITEIAAKDMRLPGYWTRLKNMLAPI